MRLGILTSHPIQYQAPWFRELAKVLDLEVFFCHKVSPAEQGAAGFGVAFDWDVDLLAGYRHRFLKNKARRPGVDHFSGCDTPEIREIIRDGKFDAIVVSGWNLKSFWQAVRACRRLGVPVIVRGDSQLFTPRSVLKRWAKEIFYRPLLRQFDACLAVGKRNYDYLRHYGVPDEKIFFAPHFVDNERFADQANELRAKRMELREEWGIPEDAFCVLFCGKFMPVKRPLDLIKAAQLLLRSHPELKLHLLFVGSGELGSAMRSACRIAFDAEQRSEVRNQKSAERKLTSDIGRQTSETKAPATFAGFLNQTEVSKAYVAADALVVPSETETWGLVVNEAMACGLPAIVSDRAGCAPDLIEEGRTGYTFPVAQIEVLAKKLAQLASARQSGFDFPKVVKPVLMKYSVDSAVSGTLACLRAITGVEIRTALSGY